MKRTTGYSLFTLFFLSLGAVAIATGCVKQPDEPMREPEPDKNLIRKFHVGPTAVMEFRDSSGRLCVITALLGNRGGNAVALDCDRLAAIDYEMLESLQEKRPR